jgi:tRNA pseudouridine-54 N-methylase
LIRCGCKSDCICRCPMSFWHSSCQERRNRPTDLTLSKEDIHTKVYTSPPSSCEEDVRRDETVMNP